MIEHYFDLHVLSIRLVTHIYRSSEGLVPTLLYRGKPFAIPVEALNKLINRPSYTSLGSEHGSFTPKNGTQEPYP